MAESPYEAVAVEPIGQIRPVGETTARIDLDADRFPAGVLQGVDRYTHAVVLVHGRPPAWESVTSIDRATVRWRGDRPHPVGAMTARIDAVEDARIGLDELPLERPRPVIDAKPYDEEFGPFGPESQPLWLAETLKE